ncbi:MAG: gamma-glutamyltranspeptidase [Hyphococcus sp.]|nr:MAG: gamma-glutamyltranspeptidase [Marinicaulis sp.]
MPNFACTHERSASHNAPSDVGQHAKTRLPGGILFLFLTVFSVFTLGTEGTFASETGVVSSASPEATDAGVEILNKGGNAIDAAIAVSLALGVAEPAGSGLGGQTVMLIARPNETPIVIHGTTLSPAATPEEPDRESLRIGHTATTIPSNLKVLNRAFEQFGSGAVAWSEVVAPAIGIAEDGFELGRFRSLALNHYAARIRKNEVATKLYLAKDGLPYREGERFKQPVLAKTLKRIAKYGAEDFYHGDIAKEIAADMKANGGWLTLSDLENFPEPPVVEPLLIKYRGLDVYTLPPPFGGWVVLRALQNLESGDPNAVREVGPSRSLALIDALHEAHTARRETPITDWRNAGTEISDRLRSDMDESGETTHFTIVDDDGAIVSVTQSIDGYFGAKAASPKLGFLYNNYMNSFEDDGPYKVGPAKAPLSSMSATVVYEDGSPVLGLGSPASARIISAVAQVVGYWIDVDRNIESAVSAYRVHASPPNIAYIESPEIDAETLSALAKRDFELRRPFYGVAPGSLDPYFGGVHAVAKENGAWVGAADPRRDGTSRLKDK